MTRLFVAARPSGAAREQLMALPRPAGPGVRWVPPAQWHVTLRFLGDADPAEVAAALERADLPGAVARLGPRVSRLGRDVVVVPVAGLDALAAAVAAATAALGSPPDPRGFRGHLTLARLRHRAACGVAGSPISADFAVRELELVASQLGPDGPHHEVVQRFACEESPGNA